MPEYYTVNIDDQKWVLGWDVVSRCEYFRSRINFNGKEEDKKETNPTSFRLSRDPKVFSQVVKLLRGYPVPIDDDMKVEFDYLGISAVEPKPVEARPLEIGNCSFKTMCPRSNNAVDALFLGVSFTSYACENGKTKFWSVSHISCLPGNRSEKTLTLLTRDETILQLKDSVYQKLSKEGKNVELNPFACLVMDNCHVYLDRGSYYKKGNFEHLETTTSISKISFSLKLIQWVTPGMKRQKDTEYRIMFMCRECVIRDEPQYV